MRKLLQPKLLLIPLIWLLPILGNAQKQKRVDIPDLLQNDPIPAGYNHDWNLGPTGARGWMYSNRLETTQARQILVTEIEEGSPAAGKLNVGDVLIGVSGQTFSYDPRKELGLAIGEAEAKNGKLALMVWRDGKQLTIQLTLARLGQYSASAPFSCRKSKRIFEQGCDVLARQMQANPKAGNGIVRSYNTLALLASGNAKYMPVIKEQIQWAASFSDVEGRSLCCWFYGPINLLLAEYVLATGDQSVMPDLKRITMEIVDGQSDIGSWGHRFARPDGRLKGYGMMNAPGLPLTVSLILARKAGVQDSRLNDAINKSVRLIRFYVGKGSVPYGDHHPWTETHEDNGKNGVAALLFNLLDDQEAAEYFSRMCVASHGAEREMGHTGNFFNMLWAMPGVALSGRNASGLWLQEFGWYYDLARRWNGDFRHQGPAQPRHDSYRNWDSTGAYLLAYAQPLKNLYITGKKSDVVDKLSRQKAKRLIQDGQGYSHRQKNLIYADRSEEQLLNSLGSWSPVVRERAATALAKREADFVSPLTELLASADRSAQLGACEAIKKLGPKADSLVSRLRELLGTDDVWLRIKAAEALAAVGKKGRAAIPDLLALLENQDLELDPRGMQQRYLCFALFDRRTGMLKGSLDGIDRKSFYAAVTSGLANEDGRARSAIGTIYKNLSFDEIQPLLPAIYQAVVEPAPSGNMFADGIRLSGLELLAKHRIAEAMPLCIEVIEMDRWGSGKRIPKCLKALQNYGGAARDLVPDLKAIQQKIAGKKRQNDNDKKHLKLLNETIAAIEADSQPAELQPLRAFK